MVTLDGAADLSGLLKLSKTLDEEDVLEQSFNGPPTDSKIEVRCRTDAISSASLSVDCNVPVCGLPANTSY